MERMGDIAAPGAWEVPPIGETSHALATRARRAVRVLAIMARIGLMGFGGGNALVPIIEQEVVRRTGLVSKDEFDRAVVVANLTPGALPVSVASGVGRTAAGTMGMVAGALGMGAPGVLLTLALLGLFSGMSGAAVRQVHLASLGISMLIAYVLCHSVRGAVSVADRRARHLAVALVAAVFLANGGARLAVLVGLADTTSSMPSLSTLDVLGLVFFVVFFTQGRYRGDAVARRRAALAGTLCLTYVVATGAGRLGWVLGASVLVGLRVLMATLGVQGFVRDLIARRGHTSHLVPSQLLRQALSWAVFALALALPAALVCPQALGFVARGIASVLMSFGGGDAYLAVGQGMFVDTGLVQGSQYFGQLATISNAMPGSIMCKMLSGVGYLVGSSYGLRGALLVALAGFGMALGVSGLAFLLMHTLFDAFESLDAFAALKRHIRPVIAGLLLSIVVQLLSSNLSVAGQLGLSLPLALALSAATFGGVAWLARRRAVGLGTLVMLSAASTLLVGNLVCPPWA